MRLKGRRLIVTLLLLLFNLVPLFAQENNLTTITITNARQTTYKKDEETGNDSIVLEGNVVLTVKKGDTSSEIKADRITYDRKTEMLFAEGDVEITSKSGNSGGENTTANSLLMNTATLEGIFDGGRVVQTQSDAINLPSGSTLVVFSDIFGKSENNTIAFKNSSLTFCDDDDPHWHIDASRTWLLPGGEFAFLNALLYVGPVPVLYLPAFYYPKDELVFNPAFGYRTREGTFIQTTTYLKGRKPLDSSSSSSSSSDSDAAKEAVQALYNFMKPSSLKEQKREGLIMHNLDQDYTGNTNEYLKFMADWYSNLGYMVGLNGKFTPSKDYITNLDFFLDFGFSNTIFANYSKVSDKGNVYWDHSNFMGLKLPFRYGANLDLTLSKPFKFTLALPLYSDQYFSGDFLTRSESTDWISYFMTMNNPTEDTRSTVSSFVWKMTASYSPKIADVFKPYISSASLSMNASVNVSSTNGDLSKDERASNGDNWTSYSPEKYFYYPSQVTPLSANASISGTLVQYPKAASTKKTDKLSFPVPLNQPDELKTPSQLQKEKEAAEKAAEEELKKKQAEENGGEAPVPAEEIKPEVTETEELEFVQPVLPDIATAVASAKMPEGLSYKLGYSITPNVLTQYTYASNGLKSPEDFTWDRVKAFMYTVKSPVALNSNLSYGGSFFSMTNKVSYDPVWQDHTYVSTDTAIGGYTEASAKSLKVTDMKARKQGITNTNTVSFKPFAYIPAFAETSVSWNTSMKLFRREFIGDKADDFSSITSDDVGTRDEDWDSKWIWDDWDDIESFTTHSLNVTLAANEGNERFKQNVTLSQTLPPQVSKTSLTMNLVFPYVTSSFSYGWQDTSKEDDTVIKNPFQQSTTVSLFDNALKLTESYNLNIQDWDTRGKGNHSDSLKVSASWKTLSLAYVMSYTYKYDLNTIDESKINGKPAGWNVRKEKEFAPYSLTFSYSVPSKTHYKWSNRITFTPNLSTSIVYDFIRATNSYLLFKPSLTFKINEFFNLTFSSTSRNAVLYWYFNKGIKDEGLFNLSFFPFNMLYDLIQSFGIWGQNGWFWEGGEVFNKNRTASGFKLQSMDMTISHELHDWSFNMTWKVSPRKVQDPETKKYSISYKPYISIGIVWNPMPSIKTEIIDEYGDTWKFNQ